MLDQRIWSRADVYPLLGTGVATSPASPYPPLARRFRSHSIPCFQIDLLHSKMFPYLRPCYLPIYLFFDLCIPLLFLSSFSLLYSSANEHSFIQPFHRLLLVQIRTDCHVHTCMSLLFLVWLLTLSYCLCCLSSSNPVFQERQRLEKSLAVLTVQEQRASAAATEYRETAAALKDRCTELERDQRRLAEAARLEKQAREFRVACSLFPSRVQQKV